MISAITTAQHHKYRHPHTNCLNEQLTYININKPLNETPETSHFPSLDDFKSNWEYKWKKDKLIKSY